MIVNVDNKPTIPTIAMMIEDPVQNIGELLNTRKISVDTVSYTHLTLPTIYSV